MSIIVRNTTSRDFPEILEMSKRVYPDFPPWTEKHLQSHIRIFPEGQFVAVDLKSGHIVGMAASLIIRWKDYSINASWNEITDYGMFSTHNPEGDTLYGAEVMVSPSMQRRGVGKKIYEARFNLAIRLNLTRICAGARLSGYHRYAHKIDAKEYVSKVIRGSIKDPTLSFQLKQGFHVLAVVPNYLPSDRESLGYAAIIEWLNPNKVQIPESHLQSLYVKKETVQS
ncbi:hypothetical protein HRbin37_00390 [bacterium HR37]|jgi:GNAT superfamily N-acetyltransferase|nr:hypothetical protein HRbin37_00390 [bacterium HR37]